MHTLAFGSQTVLAFGCVVFRRWKISENIHLFISKSQTYETRAKHIFPPALDPITSRSGGKTLACPLQIYKSPMKDWDEEGSEEGMTREGNIIFLFVSQCSFRLSALNCEPEERRRRQKKEGGGSRRKKERKTEPEEEKKEGLPEEQHGCWHQKKKK